MFLTDLIKIPSKRKYTDSGMLIVPCAFARVGTQLYTADSLGLEGGNKIIEVIRDESEVFDPESMESFRSIPITDKHPTNKGGDPISVTSKNSKELQVGSLEGVPTRDEDFLKGTLIVSDQDAINVIEEGVVELSAGYTCDVVEVDGKYYQKNIRANHIAIVERGRAGSSCRISDEEIIIDEEIMTKKIEEKELTVDSLTIDLELVQTKLDVADAKLDAAEVKIVDLEAAAVAKEAELKVIIDVAVKELTAVLVVAKELTDKELAGLSIEEIKSVVVADKLNLDLADKSSDYITARFDILVEDSAKETPMGEAMKPEVKAGTVVEDKKVDLVVDARQRMIDRQSNKTIKGDK